MSTKHYLVYGHTAKGFHDLFSTNLQTVRQLFVLQGGPIKVRTDLMKKISAELELLQYSDEYLHCPSDPDYLTGVLFPELGVGIVDGTPSNGIELTATDTSAEYVDLGECCDAAKLEMYSNEISEVQNQMHQCFEKAYVEFANGLKVHDEWEKIYISNMNFLKADQLTEEVIQKLLGTTLLDKPSCVKHRFFGGSTPYGPMDFVENITENIPTRYFIKGRPGSGKSTMLKKILLKAQHQGIDVEVYHCGFDPDSLDMLLFPELHLSIFDSTSPHEYYPSRDGDYVIDMYVELINTGTDEAYETELADIISRYKIFAKEGTAYLAEAKHHLEELEKIYVEATDTAMVDKLYDKLHQSVMKYQQPD